MQVNFRTFDFELKVLGTVGLGTEKHYFLVELGDKNLSIPLQKRRVRKIVEQHWGSPIKNPTQKRYFYETYFSATEKWDHNNDKWYVEVAKGAYV